MLVRLLASPARAELLEKSKQVGHMTVQYKVVLPTGYDAAKEYPGILVFGGGPQTMTTVDGTLTRNFRTEAEKRGYIVVAPAAPNGDLFFEEGARIFPEFLKMILADYKIDGGKFHIAGPSNGGIAAFHVAALNPQYLRVGHGVSRLHVAAHRLRSSRRSRRCASSCTSAKTMNTDGTTR